MGWNVNLGPVSVGSHGVSVNTPEEAALSALGPGVPTAGLDQQRSWTDGENAATRAQEAAQAETARTNAALVEMMKLSRQDAAPARELQSALGAIGGQQYNRYQSTFVPFENKVMADVANNERYASQVQGAINADLMQKQTPWGGAVQRFGARPGAMLAPESSGGAAVASAAARGQVYGDQRLASEKSAMTQNIVNLGRGAGEMAQSGLGQAAGIAARATISDWQYQTNLSAIDANYTTTQGQMRADQYSANASYISSLLASASGAGLYAVDPQRDGGGRQTPTPQAAAFVGPPSPFDNSPRG